MTLAANIRKVDCISNVLSQNTTDVNIHDGTFDWCLQTPVTEPSVKFSVCLKVTAMADNSSTISLRVGEDIFSQVVNALERVMLSNGGTGVCNATGVVIENRSGLLPADRSTCTRTIHENDILNQSSNFDSKLILKLQSNNISLTEFRYVEFAYTLFNYTNVRKLTTLECQICAGMIISKDEYVKRTHNGTRPFVTVGTFHSDKSVALEDGRVLLCDEGHEPGERPLFSSVPGGLVLANVLTVLSLIGILLTLITYIAFPKLRNVPGRVIMNLLVALFVALMSIVIGPLVRYPNSLCITFAAVFHYFWLASFFWMNILSIDTSYILAFKPFSSNDATKGGRYRLYIYHAYGWGTPGVMIIICLILHFCKCTKFAFSYGLDDGICWTDDGASGLYFFNIPVAILLGINMLLLCVTIHCIWRTSRQVKAHGKPSNKLSASRRELLVFIKVSSYSWICVGIL